MWKRLALFESFAPDDADVACAIHRSVEKAAADHLLGRAELTGTYERK